MVDQAGRCRFTLKIDAANTPDLQVSTPTKLGTHRCAGKRARCTGYRISRVFDRELTFIEAVAINMFEWTRAGAAIDFSKAHLRHFARQPFWYELTNRPMRRR